MWRICLVAVWILTGCESSTRTGDTTPPPSEAAAAPPHLPNYEARPDCEKAGGKWKAWCTPEARCVMPWPDAGKHCTDSSQCESRMCMVDLTVDCTREQGCIEPVIPRTGEPFIGICKTEDVSCGSYFEIRNGLVQEPYHVD